LVLTYCSRCLSIYFAFSTASPTEIYTLSLHDALPILHRLLVAAQCRQAGGAVLEAGFQLRQHGGALGLFGFQTRQFGLLLLPGRFQFLALLLDALGHVGQLAQLGHQAGDALLAVSLEIAVAGPRPR